MKRALKKSRPVLPWSQSDVIDALNNAKLFAEGIQLAVMGEADLTGFDSSAISQLLDEHMSRLAHISAQVEALKVVE